MKLEASKRLSALTDKQKRLTSAVQTEVRADMNTKEAGKFLAKVFSDNGIDAKVDQAKNDKRFITLRFTDPITKEKAIFSLDLSADGEVSFHSMGSDIFDFNTEYLAEILDAPEDDTPLGKGKSSTQFDKWVKNIEKTQNHYEDVLKKLHLFALNFSNAIHDINSAIAQNKGKWPPR